MLKITNTDSKSTDGTRKLVIGGLLACLFSATVQATTLTKEQKLGKLLYSDTSLSLEKNKACATCHSLKAVELASGKKLPAPGFVDPDNVTTRTVTSAGSVAGNFGGLNTPSAGYAAFSLHSCRLAFFNFRLNKVIANNLNTPRLQLALLKHS